MYVVCVGDEYEFRQNINEEGVLRISFDEERPEDAERIEIVSAELVNGEAVIRVRSKTRSGMSYVLFDTDAEAEEGIFHVAVLYVHRNGVITQGDFFGDCTGMLGTSQGLDIEGIGSRTKSYFWVNAFVREFIATIYEERKRHAFMMGMMILIGLAMVVMLYISNVVLS